MKRPRIRIVTVAMIKDERWIIERWLKRTSEFSDAIIALDNGSTDGTYEILRSHPKVAKVIREEPGSPFMEIGVRNKLLEEARSLDAEWMMILDADEIMDARFAAARDTLLDKKDVAWYHFREITLWRSVREYRVDKPGWYMRPTATCRLARITPKLRWGIPAKYTLAGRVRGLLRGEERQRTPKTLEARLYGASGDIVRLSDLVCLHYHFVDRERAWKVHTRYAITEAIQRRASLRKVSDILNSATARLDEEGLAVAQAEPEWGAL